MRFGHKNLLTYFNTLRTGIVRNSVKRYNTMSISENLSECYRLVPITLQDDECHKTLNIGVVDNVPQTPAEGSPVVVAVHGAPGDAFDFNLLSNEMKDKGVRFVAVEFPGFGRHKLTGMDEMFKVSHGTDGRYSVLKATLDALDINRVDVLVGHSAGTWLGYKAGAELDAVKSVMLLNTLGMSPHRTLRPFWGVKLLSASFRIPVVHSIVTTLLLPLTYKLVGFTVDADATSSLAISVETCRYADLESMAKYASKIAAKKLPVVLAMTDNDGIVETQIGMEMIKAIGIKEEEIVKYDKAKLPHIDPLQYDGEWYKKVLHFERGGHHIHKAHKQEICKQIMHILSILRDVNT